MFSGIKINETSGLDKEVRMSDADSQRISRSPTLAGEQPTASNRRNCGGRRGCLALSTSSVATGNKRRKQQNTLNRLTTYRAQQARRVRPVDNNNNNNNVQVPAPIFDELETEPIIDFWQEDLETHGLQIRTWVHVEFSGYYYYLEQLRGMELLSIREYLSSTLRLEEDDYYLCIKGRPMNQYDVINHNDWVTVKIRGRGGSTNDDKGKEEKNENKKFATPQFSYSKNINVKRRNKDAPPSPKLTMDNRERLTYMNYIKIKTDARTARQKEVLIAMEAAFPNECMELNEQVEAGAIADSKAQVSYQTLKEKRRERYPKSNDKVTHYQKQQVKKFSDMKNASKHIDMKPAVQPEPKLKVASLNDSLSIQPGTLINKGDLDPIAFRFYVPAQYFELFKCVSWYEGHLPRFTVQYLNIHASLPSSTVNVQNLMYLLFKEPKNEEYVKDLPNNEIVKYKTNVLAYILSIQHDVQTGKINRSFKVPHAARKINKDKFSDDSPFGVTFKNLFTMGTAFIAEQATSAAKVLVNSISSSKIPEYYTLTANKLKGLVEYIKKVDPYDDEDFEEVDDDLEIKFKNVQSQYTFFEDDDDTDKAPKKDSSVTDTSIEIVYPKTMTDTILYPTQDDLIESTEEDCEWPEVTDGTWHDGHMTIIIPYPTFSVYLEELIKCIPLAWRIIGRLDDYVHNSKHRYNWHRRTMKYDLFDRIEMHLEHNSEQAKLIEMYEFNSMYKERIVTHEPVQEVVPFETTIKGVNNPIFTLEEKKDWIFEPIEFPVEKTAKFYPLLFPITKLVTFSNTYENFRAAVYLRLLKPKTLGPLVGEWGKITKLPGFSFDFKPDHEKWFNTLRDDQKIKVYKHLLAAQNGDKLDCRTSVFLKMNELLDKGYGRLIFNVSPKYLLLLGDFVTQLSKAVMKNLFSSKVIFSFPQPIAFYYVSSFDDLNLNKFVNKAMNNSSGKYVLVLGDDTATIDRDRKKYIETDYSAYDSTQVSGGGLDTFPEYLKQIGFGEQANSYEQMYNEKINWDFKSGMKLEMPDDFKRPPWRMSGEPGTSIANSLTNIRATYAVLTGETTYENLGLVVKKKESDTFNITFLKGIWLYARRSNQWNWTRLPSFLLKIKTFTSPREIFPVPWTIAKCYQQMLLSQWLGYGTLENNWFYKAIGRYIIKVTPLAKKWEITDKLDNDYSIKQFSGEQIEDEEFNSFMYDRYGITVELMEDYLYFLNTEVLNIPAVYQHSLIDMLLVDC
jgi:hypothetical protein